MIYILQSQASSERLKDMLLEYKTMVKIVEAFNDSK